METGRVESCLDVSLGTYEAGHCPNDHGYLEEPFRIPGHCDECEKRKLLHDASFRSKPNGDDKKGGRGAGVRKSTPKNSANRS